jgi:prevent-host-death family protein
VVKHVSAAHAKAELASLVAKAAYQGERFIIERRGKPLAALVSVDDLDALERSEQASPTPLGALAVLGAWGEIEDEEIDRLIASIYEARSADTGRAS